ncbi:MAG: glutamine amidotransferase [Verrucomicrobiales bacterium]
MMLGALTFAGESWGWPLAAALALAVTGVVWSYRRAPRRSVRWGGPALKAIGFALLALCVLEPQWTSLRARPGGNLFAIIADNSQGLQITDDGTTQTRAQVLQSLLDPNRGTWQRVLEDTFEVRRYTFDSRLQNTSDFRELAFDGRASALGSALRTLADRFHGRPLAGVVLLTDGIATDKIPDDLGGLPPIYPVVIGGAGPACDLAVQGVSVSQTGFEDSPISVVCEVRATGASGEVLVGKLIDAMGKVIEEQMKDGVSGARTAFRFQLKPKAPGLSFFQFSVRLRSETGADRSREAVLANNQRTIVVDRGQGPYRLLYVAGRPNWEYKFLNRALQADDQVQLVALIRVAKREPKFDFRSRAGETSNPLFRGFDKQSREEAGSYDQPVFVRLNTRDEVELRGGMPRTAEELFAYHAIILDDLDAGFFSPSQAALVQKFVSERGGGFLMLGGMESFREGGYHRTPIGDVLPVYLDGGSKVAKPPGPLKLDLDREGWLEAWARLRENESDERQRLAAMPPFYVLNWTPHAKPGASVIATVADGPMQSVPALVVQRFGRGRSAAMMIGDVWRWGMRDPESRADMEKAWRQLVRWLVSEVPGRVALNAEPLPGDPNGAMQLGVRVRDSKFEPLDNATVTIDVAPVSFETPGKSVGLAALAVPAAPSSGEPGLYEATYVPRQTGAFSATARAVNAAGAEEGRAEAGWSTDLAAEEFRSLVPDRSLLERLAAKTGGEVVPAEALEALAKRLPAQPAPVTEPWSRPLWHTPWLFAVAIACLVSEWGWRRSQGLP